MNEMNLKRNFDDKPEPKPEPKPVPPKPPLDRIKEDKDPKDRKTSR